MLSLSCAALLAGLVGQSATEPPAQSGLSALATQLRPSVLFLESLDAGGTTLSSGTGFFVSNDGLIATNVHVVEGARRMVATMADGAKFDVEGIVAQDPARDVAIIAAKRSSLGLPLAPADSAIEGMRVAVLGNPLGLTFTLTDGIVSAVRREGLPERFARGSDGRLLEGAVLQVSAAVQPGSSGSPVVDMQGRVMGIISSKVDQSDSLNFAIPAEVIAALLTQPRVVVPLLQRERGRNLMISAAVFGTVGVIILGSWWLRRRKALRVADKLSVVPRGRR